MQTFNQTILDDMIQKAIRLLETSQYNDPFSVACLRSVPVNINTRMRTNGGTCVYSRNRLSGDVSKIQINICHHYATVAPEEDIYDTVSHELAHAYQLILIRDTDHGPQWKRIHAAMGGTGERCHVAIVQRNQVQRHRILDQRDGKTYTLTTRRWNQISFLKLSDGRDRFIKQETFIKPQRVMSGAA